MNKNGVDTVEARQEEDHTSAEKQKGFHTPGVGRAGKAELPANTQLITDL